MIVTTRRVIGFFSIASIVLFLAGSANMFARQQDPTVEWKLTLQDLGQRLVGVSKENLAGDYAIPTTTITMPIAPSSAAEISCGASPELS